MRIEFSIGKWKIVSDVADLQEAFILMSATNDYFGRSHCGKCGGDAVPVYRKSQDGYEYYSLQCSVPACKHEFKFGQRRDGGLFPKLNDGNGNPLPNGGWVPPYKREEQPKRERKQTQEYSDDEMVF